jgi:hypothetical protein
MSVRCKCELSGQLKSSKRVNIIRTVNYVFQNILYYFIFCFIVSLFFLNVYTFIYLNTFLFTSVFVSFSFISFVLTLFHACFLPLLSFPSRFLSFLVFFFKRFHKQCAKSATNFVFLSVRIILSPTGRICVKFNIGDYL